ncbi:hypothetical protein MKQ68_00810 [Chitinophaga horti]|uniref:DNA mimic protein DMP19 C-terminal domain-containing protein n=1 Tax=Chitinophaga horti TaxID=2920382 RepID=A0ABY6J285_9BACT|nr:hypothetical protein [Chitinophaga horti]UYQ93640.1 hypothetical protein MKQ68_00810 [Chitinophaga horti]
MDKPEQPLYDLADKLRARMQEQRPEKVPEQFNQIMLADFFVYNLHQGGFAQLLYNSGGQYLSEIEDLLLESEAQQTHTFYLRAIERCTGDIPRFHAFLQSDFVSENELKNELQAISIEYFQKGVTFMQEASHHVGKLMHDVSCFLDRP